MNTSLKVLSGFFIGAMAGVTAGILLAPDSGRKTRKKLVKEFGRVKDDLAHDVEEKFGHLKEEYNERLDHLSDLSKKGIDKLKDRAHAN